MAEMSMNRVIHAAFRRDLRRLDDALSRFANGDARRAEQLWTGWSNFNSQLTYHHTSEHAIAWPALRKLGLSDDLITQWDAEHERLAEALRSTGEAMRALRTTPSAESARAARDEVTKLSAVAAEHLDHEEADLEPFYLARENTPEMKAMGRQFGRDMKPPQAGAFLAWLQDGATSEEKAALRNNVPGPIVTIFGTLFGGNYRRTVAPVWRG